MKKRAKGSAIIKNTVHTVEITDLTDLGFGVGRISGAVIFVADTVPGDVARVRVIKVNSSYTVGRLEELLTPSELRVTDRCHECKCHSCAYKNVSYPYECALKESYVRHLFNSGEHKGTVTEKIIASPNETRYRNKAQYPVSFSGGRYCVGFFAPKSHRVTSISDCPLTPEVFSEIVGELVRFFEDFSISVYEEESGTGLLRHIYLRRGEVSGEILLTLVINGKSLPHSEELAERISNRFPDVVGILLNLNTESTNVVLSDKYKTLFGRDYIYDTLAGVRLKITAPSFYQVNHDAAELLYKKAKELASPQLSDLVLDLYCGAGSIGLSMAKEAGEVVGIEIVESAVECAKENARDNGIDNAHFYCGDATDAEKILEAAEAERQDKIKPDIVILDPPRGGSDEKLLMHIASLCPRKIVYISCNPKTLARDLLVLKACGYSYDSVTPVDLFPMTGHVESVVCLTRSAKAT